MNQVPQCCQPKDKNALWLTKSKILRGTFVKQLLLVLFILFLAQFFGIFDYIGLLIPQNNGSINFGSIPLVFLIGIVASISTCMAMIGGLVLSISSTFSKSHPRSSKKQMMIPQYLFNMGRILGFAIFGSLLGFIGSIFIFNQIVLNILTIIVGLVMLILGIRISGISPKISQWTFTLPKRFSRFSKLNDTSSNKSYRKSTPIILGALSFFLPCGFTQSVQLLAIQASDPLLSALIMSCFAIGTTPGLLGISAISTIGANNKKSKSSTNRKNLFSMLGVIVIIFSLFNITVVISNYIELPSIKLSNISNTSQDSITENVIYDKSSSTQTVTTEVGYGGYSPEVTVVYAGIPIKWKLLSRGFSCASIINATSLGISDQINVTQDLQIDISALQEGTYNYSCAMGMYRAMFKVIKIPDTKSKVENSK